ncbi:glycosyltransferase family 2 protein [Paenibacillus turpanensis]|uniref:glycosyltransferase family 2 protein n=1 Tax=Paenibacillus turpanensis TaxID=2689078 RepID=UPI0014095CA0|nr:glycosyltransferase [Paenibacillus turpanensis]
MLLSVIIPTYNRPLELAELLESLTRQQVDSMQIIVVNDAGTPVEAVCGHYPELNIEIVTLEQNVKHVHARNAGLAKAAGEYIMLCDDDDLLLPGHIRRMLHEIEGFDLVYSDVEIVHFQRANNRRIPMDRLLFAYEHDLEAMKRFSTFVSSGCLYRRSIHDVIGPFDVEMYHYWDWDFFLRVSGRFTVKRVPVASAIYAFAFDGGGDNLSGNHGDMRYYLDRLCAKHQLGDLPTKNFFVLLEEPEVQSRKASSEVVWDGSPIMSRMASAQIQKR